MQFDDGPLPSFLPRPDIRVRHAILALALMLVMPGMIGCGDPADRVAAGMSEAQVVDALGQPSSSTTDKQAIAFYRA